MIEWIIIGFCVVNTFLLIAIAGSLAKLVNFMRDESTAPVGGSREEAKETFDLPEGPLFRMENGELVQVGSPTYDQDIFNGNADPYQDGITDRPGTKNWDGVPEEKEKD